MSYWIKRSGFALAFVVASVFLAKTNGVYTHNDRRGLERKPNQPVTKVFGTNNDIPDHIAH